MIQTQGENTNQLPSEFLHQHNMISAANSLVGFLYVHIAFSVDRLQQIWPNSIQSWTFFHCTLTNREVIQQRPWSRKASTKCTAVHIPQNGPSAHLYHWHCRGR